MSFKFTATLTLVLASFAAFGAHGADKKKSKLPPDKINHAAIEEYAHGAAFAFGAALDQGKALNTKLQEFAKAPTVVTLTQAREAWKTARTAYSLTEAFRFYGGPIDDPKTGPEGFLNAWPIDESYIDYVEGNPNAGIIQNKKDFPKITRDVLLSLNEKNGEKNISTGYHAIEFLLWGQDKSLETAGDRPVSDFQKGNPTAERRLTYLKVLGDLLVEHLQLVAKGWDLADANSYGAQFVKGDVTESLRRMFVGVTQLPLDEMAGERMTVALERNDTENEQDCFSDYTLKDAHSNLQGIGQVLNGKYSAQVHGVGLTELIAAGANKKKAKEVTDAYNKADQLFTTLESKSFDRIIKAPETDADRKTARAAMKALETLAKTIAHNGSSFGLTLNVE